RVCPACRKYRRVCTKNCLHAEIIKSDDVLEDVEANFGLDNFTRLLVAGSVNLKETADTLLIEAQHRKIDPISGALGEARKRFAAKAAELQFQNKDLLNENVIMRSKIELLVKHFNEKNQLVSKFVQEQEDLNAKQFSEVAELDNKLVNIPSLKPPNLSKRRAFEQGSSSSTLLPVEVMTNQLMSTEEEMDAIDDQQAKEIWDALLR
ncbi:hypothetical protein MKW98_016116, partial [Papaver atlanticum]